MAALFFATNSSFIRNEQCGYCAVIVRCRKEKQGIVCLSRKKVVSLQRICNNYEKSNKRNIDRLSLTNMVIGSRNCQRREADSGEAQ